MDILTYAILSKKINSIGEPDDGVIREVVSEYLSEHPMEETDLNAFPTDTASGSIASFSDGADNLPLKSLVVNINPVQDLHGQDAPWLPGGGKNLLWLNNGVFKTGGFRENRQLTGIGTWVGMSASNYLAPNNIVSYTIGDNNLTVEAKSNGYGIGFECKLTAGQNYTLSWVGTNVYVGISFYDGDGAQLSYVTSGASPKTFTVPESTANAIIVLRADNANVTGEFSNVQLEEGQTATAYSPCANICPIVGYNNVTVKKAQRNIWAFNSSFSPSGYAVLVPRNTEFYLPAGTYTFSAIPDIESSSVVLGGYYADDTQVTLARLNASEERQSATFTIAKPLYKMYLIANKGGTISDIQLEVGDTDTGYEAASLSTINVSLTSGDNTSTVYNGTLDVTTGKLTVTHGNIASYSGETLPGRWISSMDVYSAGGTPTTGAQVVYELATPQTYQLTPTEVTTLLGDNTIWADTGDTTAEYRADTKLYISKKIAEADVHTPVKGVDYWTEDDKEEIISDALGAISPATGTIALDEFNDLKADFNEIIHIPNFLNPSECEIAKYPPNSISSTTTLDKLSVSDNYITSPIYRCIPGEKYTINKQSYPTNKTFYMGDINKVAYELQTYNNNVVDNSDGTYTVTIPNGVYYFRWCFAINTSGWSGDGWKTKAMICKGTSLPTEYIEKTVEIDGVNINNINKLQNDVNAIKEAIYPIEPIVFTGSQGGHYVIKSGLSVGDVFDKESNSYRYLYSTPIKSGTYWILNCGVVSACAFWCAVDDNEIIVAISDTAIAGTDSCNCKVVIPDTATKLYWDVTYPKSIIIPDKNMFEVMTGDKHENNTSDILTSNATVKASHIKLDVDKCFSANIEAGGYIQLSIPSNRYINTGIWIKMNSNESNKVTGIKFSAVDNGNEYNNVTIPADRLKTEEWVFIANSPVSRTAVTGCRITPTLATGASNVTMLVCAVVYTDFFSKPYAIINFDQAWQATEDCGAYDLLINNNIPFTITGTIENVDSQTKAKLLSAVSSGLLEIGTYGNEKYDNDYYPINTSTMKAASENMLKLLSIKHSLGVDPVSFGPANHIITQDIVRTLKDFNYEVVRVYGTSYNANSKYQKGLICLTETHTSIGQANLLININVVGVLGMFTHGVSNNPSEEDNPSLYTSYTTFSAMIATLLKAINMGCIEPITMKEFANRLMVKRA